MLLAEVGSYSATHCVNQEIKTKQLRTKWDLSPQYYDEVRL